MVSRLYAKGRMLGGAPRRGLRRRRSVGPPSIRPGLARIGQLVAPVDVSAGGAALSSDDLRKYLDDLNLQHILLNLAIESQHVGGTLDAKAATQLVREWRAYLNHELSSIGPGVSPEYMNGPLGWRTWYKQNIESPIALAVRSAGLRREGKEFQSKLREFHQRFEKAGGKTTREAPAQPSVEEMAAPIPDIPDPVVVAQEAVEVVTEAAKDAALGPVLADSPLQQRLAAALGLSPGGLRTAAIATGATVAALVAAVTLGRVGR